MAAIEEVVKWETEIYQIATTDPVVGGPDGVANLAVRQLSNRTQYLKSVQDTYKEKTDTHLAGANPHPQYALLDSPVLVGTPKTPTPPTTAVGQEIANAAFVLRLIESVVGAAPEALDTLKELADALGDDPNFAATVTTALAGKQPLDATLTALAGLATGANKLPYFTGNDTAAQTDLTSVGRDIIGKNTIADILTYLGFGERLLEADGYFELPGGLLLQWGHGSAHASSAIIRFKKPFNVTPLIVLPHKISDNGRYVTSLNYTLTGFSLYGWNGNGTANNIDSYSYLALGI